ncbi:uncharacterized protein [Dendrobates tinctorius]|uniref:uncharacterized protein isoform X2 n=1 Tax=Dendrobates tinctorius TaxID=92724 RepID=UPI003CC92333
MRMEQETQQKIGELKSIMKKASSKGLTGSRKPHKVGIITDMEDNDFWWLNAVLRSHNFSKIIKEITSINLSNISSESCTFYIYISSGYTRETFPAMRQRLGLLLERNNLIIIIDNLDDSSDSEKRRILQENQYCAHCEKNVFLFSKMERGTNYLNSLLNKDPSGSVRLKREPFSIYGTLWKNHNQQQRRKTAHGTSTESSSVYGTTTKNHNHQHRQETQHGTSTGDAGEHLSQVVNGHRVGIFSRSSDSDYSWLVEILRSKDFHPHISDVRRWRISKDTVREFIQEVRKCTFGIFYQTQKMERNTVTTIQCDLELETLYSTLGKQNVVVLIDDLEDGVDYGMSHILDTHLGAPQSIMNLQLVSYRDKMEKKSVEMVKAELEKQLKGSDLIKREPITPKSLRIFPKFGNGDHSSQREIKRHQVGIFSRSTKKDYSWLVEMLKSEEFSSHVANIKSCLIFNKQTTQNLIDDINHCTFGILYHSKNRGTVNVTDVTDSLYDEELETLQMILGKENLLVIIDDLEDSSDSQQTSILQEQPSIAERAADLLLVSHDDKMDPALLRKNMDKVKALLQGADGSIENQPETSRQENRGAVYDPFLEESNAPHMPPAEQQPSYVERPTPASSRSTAGIFSRSEERDYFWLKKLLASEEFGHKDVHCYKTLGNDEVLAFKVKFMILYHSVKNGKIRLTDSKDSLYHTELEQLSIKFGKRKVIVVIDDLDEIGHKMKQQILERQPSLGAMVAEIFLFTRSEKKNLDQDKHRSRMSESTMDKISNLKKCLT